MANVVMDKIKSGAKVVDVRTPEEFQDGAYPGAVNIPLAVLPVRMGELEKGESLVLYCAAGGRSAQATRLLKGAGFVDVTNAGGLGDMPR